MWNALKWTGRMIDEHGAHGNLREWFCYSLDSSDGFATYAHIKMYENLCSMLNILYFKSWFNKVFKKHGSMPQ